MTLELSPEQRKAALTLARCAGQDKSGLTMALQMLGVIPDPESDELEEVDENHCRNPECGIEVRPRTVKQGHRVNPEDGSWRYRGAHGLCTRCYHRKLNQDHRKRKAIARGA